MEDYLAKQMAVSVIDGKKRLVLRGRTIQTKAQVAARIGNLAGQIDDTLPAARAGLDGEAMKAKIAERMERQIADLGARRDALDAADILADAQGRIDRKLERLGHVRDALTEILPQLDDD